jgi:hypothetical protein
MKPGSYQMMTTERNLSFTSGAVMQTSEEIEAEAEELKT